MRYICSYVVTEKKCYSDSCSHRIPHEKVAMCGGLYCGQAGHSVKCQPYIEDKEFIDEKEFKI